MQRRTFLSLGASLSVAALLAARQARAEARYEAVGRLRTLHADGVTVFIAHEAIPGVMGAMTMSFTARAPSQLAGLRPGARVRFGFTVTDDGRRLLDHVERVEGTAP